MATPPISRQHRPTASLRTLEGEYHLARAATLFSAGSTQDTPPIEQPDALNTLAALVHDDLLACNRVIVEHMQSQVELIPRLAAHLVAAGGKRLRPILTLASAKLCGYSGGQRHVALAACV